MTKLLVRAFALLLLVFPARAVALSGIQSIGPTGDFSSISAAIGAIQTNGLTGPLVLELQAAYVSSVETFPLTIPALNGASATNTLTIRPASGATGLVITSANTTTATVDLNGAQFLIIDGRPGGTGTAKQLTIANTSTSGRALRFINEASGNTVTYTTLRGVNTSASSGVVVFSTTTGAAGNDNNTIDRCDIGDGASTPANCLYALGTAAPKDNSGNTVSNCNVFNFYSGSVDAAGVRLGGGNTGWTISGNSFYQTSFRAAVAAVVRPIYVNNTAGSNFMVTGNFIGSTAPNLNGSPWTTTGTTVASRFVGIDLYVGTSPPSSVQGNEIRSIIWTSASNATDSPGVWCGIQLNEGAANIGTVTGNVIGRTTGTGAVSVTTSGNGGNTFGIGATSTGTLVINNNTIGSINVNGSSTSVSASFTGIQTWSGTTTISGNLIGNASTPNSINSATSSTSTTGQQVLGIHIPGGVVPIPNATISGNTIANLNNNYIGTAATGRVCGIATSGGSCQIVGNTIRNLTTTSKNGNDTVSHAVCGIEQTSTAWGQNVSQNLVHSLAVTAGTGAVAVTGIYYSGADNGTNIVARNLVHSLAIPSTRSGSRLYGMFFGAGIVAVQNNMVRVGLDAGGLSTAETSYVRGIFGNGLTTSESFCHNSIYVGGVSTSGANGSAAFGSAAQSGTRFYRNNIFVNARGNAGGAGKHYAVIYQAPATMPNGLAAGGNIIRASGVGGVFGWYDGDDVSTLAQWQAATGQDAVSAVADPLFNNPIGDAATVDLHLQPSNPAAGGALAIAGITDDFDGNTRSGVFADIGADAGDFTISSDVLPPSISYPPLTSGSTSNRVLTGWASIADNVDIASDANAPRLYFKKSTDADVFGGNTSADNGWKHVTTSSSNSPYSFTIDYTIINGGGVTIGDTIQYFVVAQDSADNLGASPAAATGSVNPPVPNIGTHGEVNSYNIGMLSGTKTVGAGGDYPSLSGAGGLFAAINAAVLTDNLVVIITSDIAETGNVSLNEFLTNEYPAPNNGHTLTIQPSSATMRTISGSATNGLITLNGSDGVIIDGRFGGMGRYLTFRNTNTSSTAGTFRFINDACNNSLRSIIVEGANLNGALGVIGFSTGTVTGNDNNQVSACLVRNLSTTGSRPMVLIGFSGTAGAVANSSNTISNNELFNFNAYGIHINFSADDSCTISGNNIYEVSAANSSLYGIYLQGGGTNIVTGNFIHDLLTTGTASYGIHFSSFTGGGTTTISRNRITAFDVNAGTTTVYGISAEGNMASTLNVVNNQITLSPYTTGSKTLYGLYDTSSGSVANAFFNSIVIGGTESGSRNSWASYRNASSTHIVRNNLFLNFRTGGTGSHFAVGSEATGGSLTASNNVYAGTGATAANFMDFNTAFGAAPVSFATWRSSTGDTNSQAGIAGTGSFTAAMFVDAANGDLHLVPGGNFLVNAAGIPIAGVTDDYDGDLRSFTTPTIGADEAVALVGIAGWRQTHFGISTNTGNAADSFDFDNDGLPNLIEWACYLNPTTASALPANAVRNGANVEFTYTRSVVAVNAGTGFAVEWSDTLANDWQSTGVSEEILSDDGIVQQVKATLPAGSNGRRFVHLKVTAAP